MDSSENLHTCLLTNSYPLNKDWENWDIQPIFLYWVGIVCNRVNADRFRPAWYSVRYGTPWCTPETEWRRILRSYCNRNRWKGCSKFFSKKVGFGRRQMAWCPFFPIPLCFESQVLAVAGGAWCRHNYSRPQRQYSTTEPRLDKTCSFIDWGHPETWIKHDPILKRAPWWMQFWDILLCKEDDTPSANQGCWPHLFSS